MKKRELLQLRLNEIGQSIALSGHGLALIGLGSVGLETDRLDEYSDLDFFAIVEKGFKHRYIDNLDWLSSIAPLAFQFRNTADGFKVLFSDGVFCEFAVFELAELPQIPFAPGRIIWKRSDVDEAIAAPSKPNHPPEKRTTDWLVGEALTNLYVGVSRYLRGEKLSAARFVQQFAVDRILEIIDANPGTPSALRDPFSIERRIEQRNPEIASQFPAFVQGYDRTRESALAILDYLCSAHAVNHAMEMEIRRLCALRPHFASTSRSPSG